MEPKRRQSSTCSSSEELFEFVDYSSVSNFERLSTAIAEIFASWGIKDGNHGIFNDTRSSNNDNNTTCSRSELLSIGDETYNLTYSYHAPISRQHYDTSHHDSLAYADFCHMGQDIHPLHRSTGLDRLFVLTPAQDSLKTRLFSQARSTVELPQAKILLSACALAIQEVKCTVPVFVPVGQERQGMYIGYLLHTIDPHDPLYNMEFRFNTSVTYPLSSQHIRLDGLYQLFAQKMDTFYEDCGVLAPTEDERECHVAGAFTYTCKNWFDENWKTLDGWTNTTTPSLPFGSYNDPLRGLSLKTLFPLAPQSTYLDNTVQSNMNLITSQHWFLSCESAPPSQQRSFLSMLLDNLISSWIRDPGNHDYLQPYDASNQSGGDDLRRGESGLVRNLFHAMGPGRKERGGSGSSGSNKNSNNKRNSVSGTRTDSIMDILEAIFEQTGKHETQQSGDHVDEKRQLYSASALGLRLQHGTSVPYKSFFWNLLFYALHVLSDPARTPGTSPIELLRSLWAQVLRQLRSHWEHATPIPNVDTSLYGSDKKGGCSSNDNDVCGIDLRYNLLHQKLAMINCCIERCIRDGISKATSDTSTTPKRQQHVSRLFDDLEHPEQSTSDSALDKFNLFLEKLVDPDDNNETSSSTPTESTHKGMSHDDAEMSDSDLFFDPLEDFVDDDDDDDDIPPKSASRKSTPITTVSDKTAASHSSSLSDVSEVTHPRSMSESFVRLNYSDSTRRSHLEKASSNDHLYQITDPDASEGCKHQHPTLKLLKTNEPMWIPETQDGGFMTEDMVKQQADVFERLGTSEDATQMRAKLQSAQLYSDMQAFKAANPHAILEDFVRWHSPKDWIQEAEDEQKGQLSARMADPRNIWQELWKSSPRIPASRQKPLFDVYAEGEKALHYLETLSIHEVFGMLLPTVALIAYDTLVSHPVARRVHTVVQGMQELGSITVEFPWHQLRIGKCSVTTLLSSIRKQESLMCNAISLLRKLPHQDELVNRLLTEQETEIQQGSERDTVLDLFCAEQPSSREYVLYSNCPGAGHNDQIFPMRQYALIKDNELRVVDMSPSCPL